MDKKFSDKRKSFEILEEVFIKCDNFKTTQGLRDHCDQAHNNLPINQKYKCDKFDLQNVNEKGLKQHQKMKHNSLQY